MNELDLPIDAEPPQPRPRSPLGYRDYRELWITNTASNFGSQVQVVGAGWLMASLTSAPQVIALVQTAINLPIVLFVLLGGALADNYDRRRIMLLAQCTMLVVATLLAVLSATHHIAPWSLLALVFVVAAFGSLTNPSWQASTRDILPRDMISRAVGLNATSFNLARTAGPALGGVIISAGGVAFAFAANAVSFIGFIVALLRWKPAESSAPQSREPVLPAIVAGIGYGLRERNVRNAVIRGGISGLSASTVFALLPVIARQQMGGDALIYGFLLAAFGGGAVCSALGGGWLRERYTPDVVVRMATAMMTAGLLLIGVAPASGAVVLGAALCGGGWTLANSSYNTTVQLASARWVTARSLALYQTTTFGGLAVGSLIFGWVAQHYGVGTAFVVAAAAHAAAGVIGMALPLPRYEDLHVDPLNLWRPPTPVVEIAPDSGPVRVELAYRIAPDRVAEFQLAMRDRAAIRRRDGARNWSLWRDTGDPAVWIESYDVRDWAEYLRHNARRTEADRGNREIVETLTEGGSRPAVRRLLRAGQ